MAKIKTKRERVKFASDNVAGACPEVLDAIIKANDGDSTPYGNDPISTELQDKFSEIFEKEVIRFSNSIRNCRECFSIINNDTIIWKYLLS
jgi:threonine aldolase